MNSVIIVAGGSSSRYGRDKLTDKLLDSIVLKRTADIFCGICDEIIIVGHGQLANEVPYARFVEGGATRTQSVINGLRAVSNDCNYVAIHDGARPYTSRQLVRRLFDEVATCGSAVPKLPVTDTTWRINCGSVSLDNREQLFTVQTPQVFDYNKLKQAFELKTGEYPDESSRFFDAYGTVNFVEGERTNVKVTFDGDVPDYRIGCGADVHAFGEGNGIIVGGVKIPYGKKLVGHSDADVLCHAVCDAVLSASGNNDIGHQFPDTDDKYLGIDSMKLLEACVSLADNCGYQVINVSAVIICQQPKMAPFLDEMAHNLAVTLDVADSCVNLTATTTEHLGMLGNGDGIAVQAYALLCKRN